MRMWLGNVMVLFAAACVIFGGLFAIGWSFISFVEWRVAGLPDAELIRFLLATCFVVALVLSGPMTAAEREHRKSLHPTEKRKVES